MSEPMDFESVDGTALCDGCGEDFLDAGLSPNMEALEVLDRLLCDECAESELADNGQFGVGA